jgi:predicted ATPase/DNA-binding XRE family transcriptional regulator
MHMENGGPAEPADFATLLRDFRLAKGLSQDRLAERAGLSAHAVSALERGFRRWPHRETVQSLCRALDLDQGGCRAMECAARRSSMPRRRARAVGLQTRPNEQDSNLPVSLAVFIGRHDELADLEILVNECRFVTIAGPGGIGKTQTALRVAATVANGRQVPVRFVNLAEIGNPELVATATAAALNAEIVPDRSPMEAIAASLRAKETIVVFDNCEHVVHEAALLVETLLSKCTDLRVIATSREPLRTAGERVYRLAALKEDDAASLFVERARSADASFALVDGDKRIVHEICQRLARIPLAIELAAARTTALSLPVLAQTLRKSLEVLTTGRRTAPVRQQTMQTTIAWSYDLLGRSERAVFERLSVFAGGCTLQAATSVCADSEEAEPEVAPAIASLVDKSLVTVDRGGREPRYRLLEPFREYARAKLVERGQEDDIARRHVETYIRLAWSFARHEHHYTEYYDHPRAEIGNWRAAVDWALVRANDPELGMRLVSDILTRWGETEQLAADARRFLQLSFSHCGARTSPELLAKLKAAEANVAMHFDEHQLQFESASAAVSYHRSAGDQFGMLRSQLTLGKALANLGRPEEAESVILEGLELARAANLRSYVASSLSYLAHAYGEDGNLEAAQNCLAEALQIVEQLDDRVEMDMIALDFIALSFAGGRRQEAIDSLTNLIGRGFNDFVSPRVVVSAKLRLAEYMSACGHFDDAKRYCNEALTDARKQNLEVIAAAAASRLADLESTQNGGLARAANKERL